MDTMQWLLIGLLLLLIAGGIFMLTRSPGGKGQQSADQPARDHEADSVASRDVGGSHVASADAGTVDGPQLYDQEADLTNEGGNASYDDAARQDTATGADVPVVEDEPIIHENDQDAEAAAQEDLRDPFDHGDREQMTYGQPPAEDFASETTYATPSEDDDALDSQEAHRAAPGSDNPGPQTAHEPDQVRDPDQGSPGGASQGEDEATYAEHTDDHTAGADNVGPQAEGEAWSDRSPDQGSPGSRSRGRGQSMNAATADSDTAEANDVDAFQSTLEESDQEFHSDGQSAEHLLGTGDGSKDDTYSTQGAPHYGSHAATPDELEDEDDREVVPGESWDASGDNSVGGHDAGSENPGPEEGEGAEIRDPDQGSPGLESQSGDEATYDSEEITDLTGEQDTVAQAQADHADGTLKDETHRADHDGDVHDDEHRDSEFHDGEHRDSDVHDDEDHDREFRDGKADSGGSHDSQTAGFASPADHDDQAQADHADGTLEDETHRADHGGESHDGEHRDGESHDGEGRDTEFRDGEDHDREFRDGEGRDSGVDDSGVDDGGSHDSRAADFAPLADHDDQAQGTEAATSDEAVHVEPSPYGPGSALPLDDGSAPEGFDIKGNAGSMLFHTPDSPGFEPCTAEVWFENEDAARSAGFAHWDRKRR